MKAKSHNRNTIVDRRSLLLHSAAWAAASAVPRWARAQVRADGEQEATSEFVEVACAQGRLRGRRENGVCIFRGIRYAAPPLGSLRFKAPRPPESWRGVRDALEFGHPAVQAMPPGMGGHQPAPDEDCLVLNVWTPEVSDGKRRPVMFYCHGGGFSIGSGASPLQDGSNLARLHDVVVVQSNHRLGIMGYLFLADALGEPYENSANAGMLDIVEALRWTTRNIEAFGGDAGNIMVWGESGGGAKTSCIYAMPSAAPYFHKASIESGPGVRMTERETAVQTTRWVLAQLGLSPKQALKLLSVPAHKLLELQMKPPPNGSLSLSGGRGGIGASGVGGFSPVVDGKVLPTHPFDPIAPPMSADKPLMVGFNRDEIVFFYQESMDKSVFSLDEEGLRKRIAERFGIHAPRLLAAYRQDRPDASPAEIAVAIESAAFAGAGSIAIAERKAAQGRSPVFMYMLTDHINALVPGTNYQVGAMHAMDIRLKFNNLAIAELRQPTASAEERAEHQMAADNMSGMWAAFARSSQPSIASQPTWPAYDLNSRATMMIGAQCHVANDPYAAERKAWAELN